MGGGSKKQKVGNRYYLGFVLVPCRQQDNLLEIEMSNKQAWLGRANNRQISVSKMELFGGDEREGGFEGNIDVQGGNNDQAVNSYLLSAKGGLTSAMRGVVSLVFRQPYVSANTGRLPSIRTKHLNVNGIHRGWQVGTAQVDPEVIINGKSIHLQFNGSNYTSVGAFGESRAAIAQFVRSLKGKGWVNDVSVAKIDINGFGNQPEHIFRYDCNDDDYEDIATEVETWTRGTVNLNINTLEMAYATSFFVPLTTEKFIEAILGKFTGNSTELPKPRHLIFIISNAGDLSAAEVAISALGSVFVTGVSTHNFVDAFAATPDLEVLDNTSNGSVAEVTDTATTLAAIQTSFVSWVDMNPAHIIRCLWTDPMRGGTVSDADIGDSFVTAANLFYSEGLGFSPKFRGLDLADTDRKDVERHADAVSYRSNQTGKIELIPIRDDYDVNTLTVLDSSIVMDWSGLSRPRPSEIPNQLTVIYTRRDGKDGSVTRSNVAAVRRRGRVVKASPVRYLACTSRKLATRLCLRDLRTVTSDVLSGTIPLRYLPPNIECGSVLIINEPALNFNNIVMRVSETRIGKGDDATAYITISEDKFTTTQAVEIDDILTVDPSEPQAMPHRLVTEASYFQRVIISDQDVIDAELIEEPDLGQLIAAGSKANSYQLEAILATSTGGDWTDQGVIDFQPYGVLINSLSADPSVTTFDVLLNETLFDIFEGTLAAIGEEIIRVDNLVDNEDGTVTVTCGRGCLDGIPSSHMAGAYFLAIASAQPLDIDFIAGQSVSVKMLSRTGSGQQALNQTATDVVTFASRAIRPYPVGNMKVDGTFTPTGTKPASIALTWAHRDRTIQTTPDVADYTDANIGPETGVYYETLFSTYNEWVNIFGTAGLFDREFLFLDPVSVYEAFTPTDPVQATSETVSISDAGLFDLTGLFDRAGLFDGSFTNATVMVGVGVKTLRDDGAGAYENWITPKILVQPLLPATNLTAEEI